jgi:hypothetical protein
MANQTGLGTSPGVPTNLPTVAAQITTQTNPGAPSYGINSSVQAEQQLAVIGPVYYSPGGVLNNVGPANFNLVTGGGP